MVATQSDGQEPDGLEDAWILKREVQEEALRKGLIPYIPERPQPVKDDDEE